MSMRMLIDARHREETRVAVVQGNRIEEFDFESAEHEQLKGNIYLAKVTRVEPSLQAAFVEYGGNRHGFLAFSEIHPDYYQIPKADRDRLLAEEAAAAAEEAALREQEEEEEGEPSDILRGEAADEENGDFIEIDTDTSVDTLNADGNGDDGSGNGEDTGDDDAPDSDAGEDAEDGGAGRRDRGRRGRGRRDRGARSQPKASDEAREKRFNIRRRYKIQDVIHRRQVMLVQVVKEERGNKGAALTTYLSLAGRYCVLMPNTSHGGGISRKISSAADRKRLKSIVSDLALPATMGCIIRTAGLQRTRTEIKRDFDYLARLWDEIRENTLKGTAPALIHSDSDLIKRAIRDIYNREIDEVLVEGEGGYKLAKDFMKLLMPSHAKKVRHYADPVPLFQRFGVEDQLSAMYHPVVQLKSGGYIVINPTEALVSIDINSGRSTKEHNIEQTALATNLEAAREIARQLRLRDMAGLIVIDFIDMEHNSNSRKVEKAMKEALKNDRARIQVGRISSFGLMEMSRQRLRTGVLEASTRECPHCEGTGLVRTASSAALSALRLIEEEAARGRGSQIMLSASQEAAVYVLNHKRHELAEIEDRYGVRIAVMPNNEAEGAKMSVTASGPRPEKQVSFAPIVDEEPDSFVDDEDEDFAEEETVEARDERPQGRQAEEGEDGDRPRRKRRRRGRRGGRGRRDEDGQLIEGGEAADDAPALEQSGMDSPALESMDAAIAEAAEAADGAAEVAAEKPKRRSRRRKADDAPAPDTAMDVPATEADAPAAADDAAAEDKPKRRPRRKKADAAQDAGEATAEAAAEVAAAVETAEPLEAEKPKRRSRAKKADADIAPPSPPAPADDAAGAVAEAKPKRRSRAKKADAATDGADAASAAAATAAVDAAVVDQQATAEAPVAIDAGGDSAEPPRKGWWQRTFG